MRPLLLLALAALSLSTGCKRRARTDATTTPAKLDSVAVVAPPKPTASTASALEALARLDVRNAQFQTLQIRGSARFEGEGTSQRVSYRIHIERGQRIWAVATVLGFEGARLLATPGGCQVIVRPQRKVYEDGYGKVREQIGFNVDYAVLEDILLGNLSLENPFYRRHTVALPTLPVGWLPGAPSLTLAERQTLMNYFLNGERARPERIVVVDSAMGPSSLLRYDRWQSAEAQLLPYLLDVEVQRPRYGRLVLEHREVVLNPTGLSFSFAVPAEYERVR